MHRSSHTHTMMTMTRGLILIGALIGSQGCAGSKADVTFPDSASPISLSSTLRSSDGRILDDDDLQTVGSFETKFKRSWAIFYSGLRFRKEIDFSKQINEAVAEHGGEAVTNLEIRAFNCGMNYVIPLTILPFWPGCVKVKLAGNVVKQLPAAAATPTPTPTPAAPATTDETSADTTDPTDAADAADTTEDAPEDPSPPPPVVGAGATQ